MDSAERESNPPRPRPPWLGLSGPGRVLAGAIRGASFAAFAARTYARSTPFRLWAK
ncbi:MAG: hypothetical protein M0C28_21700 [Candidatus Moduliflexus flocculans]|nr:hypothetical protein [Candidatus Moduliflexus flocculans]